MLVANKTRHVLIICFFKFYFWNILVHISEVAKCFHLEPIRFYLKIITKTYFSNKCRYLSLIEKKRTEFSHLKNGIKKKKENQSTFKVFFC